MRGRGRERGRREYVDFSLIHRWRENVGVLLMDRRSRDMEKREKR